MTSVKGEAGPPEVGRNESGNGRHGGAGAGRAFAWMLVVTGAAGLLAAWVITIDKFRLLEDPGFTPGCSL
ncbi:hypothetical protein PUR26_01055, partial [Streptomyces sp. SP18CS02]|nr:hypothetical protein [Streptomyces sp. SP18CS02]